MDTGNTYTLKLPLKCAELKRQMVMTTATTRIGAWLHGNALASHSLPGLDLDDKDTIDATASSSSKYEPCSDRAELLCKAALKIVDQAVMRRSGLLK